MDATHTSFDETLRLTDCIDDHKRFFSESHCKRLVDEALKGTRAGAEKLEFVLALARRCKTGLVSPEQLAGQVDNVYPPRTVLQTQEGDEEEDGIAEGVKTWHELDEDGAEEKEDCEEEHNMGEGEGKEGFEEEADDDEEKNMMEGEVPDDSEKVKKLVEEHWGGFCAPRMWTPVIETFVVPGEGYWKDVNRIELFRTSTYEDLASATPKPMPVYIDRNPLCWKEPKYKFKAQQKGYHLCKKVAVSLDGEIFRATDVEIEAALAEYKGAPKVDAATYVKLAQETLRSHEAVMTVQSGSGEKKRQRLV